MGSVNSFQNRWELQGHESEKTFGLNRVNFGARVYNPTIGRWDRVDNFSEAAPNLTGYRYSFNNPVNVIDPDGNFEYSDGYGIYSSSGSTGMISFSGTYSTGRAEPEGQGTPQQQGGCGGPGNPCPEEKGKLAAVSAAFLTATSTDLAIPDPTDAAWPKWVVYGVGATAAYAYLNADELTAKMEKEIDRIGLKNLGKPGIVYSLVASKDGNYNVYTLGSSIPTGTTFLRQGEVWKYGETTSSERYSTNYLNQEGVRFVPLMSGTQVDIKIKEKILIYSHFMLHGSLPAGNKIFR